MRRISMGSAILALSMLAGCVSLADRIAQPRTNSTNLERFAETMERVNGVTHAMIVARGGNRIVYRIVAAADYHMTYRFSRVVPATGHGENDSFHFDLAGHPDPVPAKATVIFLHGWGDSHITMLPWAMALARHGYLGIVPDLRNHGQSDRAPAGYGVREARDVVDLIAELRRRGQLHGPVYLFGISYGATTAVFAAGDPTANVDGVIAMEPFVNAGKGIRKMTAFLVKHPMVGGLTSLLLPGAGDPRKVDAAIIEAGRRLHLSLDAVDIGPLLRGGATCTALVSSSDRVFDPADLRAFADAPRVRYLELPEENHFSLPMRIDLLADPLADWLAQSSQCPPLRLPVASVANSASR